jgi:hypothetical protein
LIFEIIYIDSSTSDFVAIWYPGKLNTLTFNGDVGKQVKECLIKLCTASPVGILENTDFNVGLDNLNLEIEILKSRVDSMQSLMNSQGSGTAPKICELSNEIALLKIDLEEEKFRNVCLEREVKRLQQKVELINSYRNGSASTTNNSELINIPPTQTNPVKNTDTSTDNLFYTTAEIPTETEPLLGELDKTFDSTNIDNNSSMHASHVCDCKIGSKALKDIQSDIAILQRQMKSTNTIIDSTNNIIESMSVILFPSGSESGSVPYDTRLDTLFREFSVILEEKDKTIKTLQEKLAHVENERASLNLTSEISGQNTPPNFQFNECSEQKICQSNRNDNPDLKTQSTDELNKGNNRILNTLPITSPKDASLVRKQKVSRAYQNAKGEVNTKLNCNLSTRNRKNVDTCHRTRSSTLPLTKSLKDNLHHGTSQNGNIGRNPPSGHTRDKTNQIHNQSHSAKYKTNPFRKSQYRNRPPSCLRRPSKDWLNHLHLVRQITATCSPNTEMPSQPIAFLPLCGAI